MRGIAELSKYSDYLSSASLFYLNKQPGIDQSVRSGDIFATIIEYFYDSKDLPAAFEFVKKMQAKRIALAPYLDQEMVPKIFFLLTVTLD